MRDKVGHIAFFLISKEHEPQELVKSAILRSELCTTLSQLPHGKVPLGEQWEEVPQPARKNKPGFPPPLAKHQNACACRDLTNKNQEYQGPILTY